MAATMEPPSPPRGVNIVQPSSAPKAPPAPTREIHVNPGTGAASDPGPRESVRQGSAKESVFGAIRKKAGITEPVPTQPATPPAKPAQQQSPESKSSPAEQPTSEGDPTATGNPSPQEPGEVQETPTETQSTQPQPAETKTGKEKVNPWRLVDQYKERVSKLEKELVESKSSSVPEQEKKGYLTQIEQLQKRNSELEREMSFVNYEQSAEFQEKYQKPYERKFNDIMSRLNGVQIKGEDGTPRKVNFEDVLEIVNLPLNEAYERAEAKFGRAGDWVVQRGEELRSIWSERQSALNEAKAKGTEHQKTQRELATKQQTEIKDYIARTWTNVNESALKDEKFGKYFSPVEGDQEGNQSLAKGFSLVDRAFSENPEDPSLTTEQRNDVIRRHAAVRNRAAAAGRLIKWNQKLESEIAELKAELSRYKSSTPETGGGAQPQPAGDSPGGSAWSRVQGALRAKAR